MNRVAIDPSVVPLEPMSFSAYSVPSLDELYRRCVTLTGVSSSEAWIGRFMSISWIRFPRAATSMLTMTGRIWTDVPDQPLPR